MATPSYEAEGGPGSMIYAGGHCHAPSCLSIELYSNETGTPELLCRQVSYFRCADISLINRGGAAAATWVFRGDYSRRRRG